MDQEWDKKSSLDYVKDNTKCVLKLVYTEDNDVIGFVFADKKAKTLVIQAIGVVPDHMNKGIAKRLMREVFDYAKQSGVKSLSLTSDPK